MLISTVRDELQVQETLRYHKTRLVGTRHKWPTDVTVLYRYKGPHCSLRRLCAANTQDSIAAEVPSRMANDLSKLMKKVLVTLERTIFKSL